MSRRRILALLALVGAIAVAGVVLVIARGDPASSDEYVTQTEAALETFVNLDELSAPLANPDSVEQYVAGVRDIVAEIGDAIGELEAIEAPDDVAAIHDELIAVVEGYGAAFPPVADAAEAGDDAALQASAAELQAAALDFQRAATVLDQRFQAEGFELTPLAG